MAWTATEDARQFLAAAGPCLRARAASNTVLLTAAENVAASGPAVFGDESPLFGWWASSRGSVDGAFIHTPPFPAQLSPLPGAAVEPLAELLADRGRSLAGVGAAAPLAAAFAAAWSARRGETAELDLRLRLYRLATLHPPQPAPTGRAAVATVADHALVRGWIAEFERETGALIGGSRTLAARLARGSLTIWRDAGGTPVALAGWTSEVGGTRRLGPVYTVQPHRRNGYGAAVTAVACSRALDRGTQEILLYADLDNPTSNTLYQRIGFEPVEDRVALRFTPRAEPAPRASSVPEP
jgi:predicted GNAT family acetyltransferase